MRELGVLRFDIPTTKGRSDLALRAILDVLIRHPRST